MSVFTRYERRGPKFIARHIDVSRLKPFNDGHRSSRPILRNARRFSNERAVEKSCRKGLKKTPRLCLWDSERSFRVVTRFGGFGRTGTLHVGE